MKTHAAGRRTRWCAMVLVSALVILAPLSCLRHSVMQEAEGPETVEISVSNNNTLDINVYAVNQSMRIRLGTVTTASTKHFTLNLHEISASGEFQLRADPIGSTRTFSSEAIHVFAGQAVEWVLQADLRQSSLVIRG